VSRIALRISDTELEGVAYDDLATNQYRFDCVEFPRPIVSNERDVGKTLSGRAYSHLLSRSKIYNPVISTNELDEMKLAFLESYWDANKKYIALYDGTSWGNYIEVITESGDFPLSFIDDLEDLPEVSLKLTGS